MKKLLNRLLLLMLAVVCCLNVSAQEKKLFTGILNDPDGGPVVAATVKEKGTTNQVSSDLKGVFKISVAPGAILVISCIGFETTEFAYNESATANIKLAVSSQEMTSVVVTALGIKREKKSLGYAVQELSGATIVATKETNLANALTGKVAGLQVIRSSDGPGGSSKMLLRGSNSLTGSNQPLIVVDGIPLDNFTGAPDNGYWNRPLDQGNGIADINPEDIESLTVLKGPSSAALYGSRAGNGVILITTKAGKKQSGLGITVTSSIGVENIFTNPEMQSAYGQGNDNIYANNVPSSWGPKAEGQPVTNWDGSTVPLSIYDNVANYMQQGLTQNYGVSFQQLYKQSSIYTSVNYLEDQGMVPEMKLTRLNLIARAVSKFGKNDRWTTDTKFQYSNLAGHNRPIGGRDNSSAYTLYLLPRSIDIRDFSNGVGPDGQMIWYPGAGSQVNPYWGTEYNLNDDSRDRFLMNGSLKYNITSWLNAEIKGGADMYTTNTQTKVYGGSPLTPTGSYGKGKLTFSETDFSTLISATKDDIFGKFGGGASVGGNLMTQKYSALSSNSGQLVVPNLFSLNNGVSNPTVTEGFSERKINSLYGTLQVNYDAYVFLDLTFRNDWSSTLSKTNSSFFYPSFSLSYVYTDMMRNLGMNIPTWLTFGKIRASYAEVGNDLPPYQLYNTYGIGKDPNGNTTASRNNVLLDPNVQSELIKSWEIGTELRAFNNRVGLDFAWYKSNATNQLLDLPMDPQSGYSAKKINAGDIQNTGIEIMLDGKILNDPAKITWNITVNFSTNNNTIEALGDGILQYKLGGFDDVEVLAVVGEKYGEIYGTRYNRVKDQNSPNYNQIILNADGLPTRDPAIVRLGNQGAVSNLGVINSFGYKNFTFSFQVDGRFGGQLFSATQVALQASGNAAVTAPGGVRDNFVADGVVSDGTGGYVKNSIAVTQQAYWRAIATANNLGISEANMYDASNVRLRNAALNYELPARFLSKTPIQKAKIGVSCNNVWMISSHVRGIDPESVYATNTNATGFENAGLPTTRTILFNLSLSF